MHFRKESWVGIVYFLVGVFLLLCYFFVLSPLSEQRFRFDTFRESQEQLAQIRDSFAVIQAKVAGVQPPAGAQPSASDAAAGNKATDNDVFKWLDSIRDKALALSRAKVTDTVALFTQSRTELEEIEIEARKTFRDRISQGQDLPVSLLFLQYLFGRDQSLFSDPLSRYLAVLSAPLLSTFTFLIFGAGVSFFINSVRILRLSTKIPAQPISGRYYFYPFLGPILALLMVVTLRGFGPIFTVETDPITAKVILIIVLACAFSPLLVIDTLREFVTKAIDREAKGET